jgi:DNA-directed RNA polymerase sigma subunit (sigma70/sigma32)
MGTMDSKREDDALQRRYLKEIIRYPLLSAEEEVDLARKARDGDLEARRTLIVANLRLVITIARTFSSYRVPFLDLVEEGNLGLIKAVASDSAHTHPGGYGKQWSGGFRTLRELSASPSIYFSS